MPTSRLRAAAGNTEDRTGGATLTALRAITEDVPDLPTAIRTAGFVVRISRAAVAPIKTVKRVITANWAAKSNTSAVTKTLSSVATMMVTGEATGATGVIIAAVLVLLLIKLLHVARRKRFLHSCEFSLSSSRTSLALKAEGYCFFMVALSPPYHTSFYCLNFGVHYTCIIRTTHFPVCFIFAEARTKGRHTYFVRVSAFFLPFISTSVVPISSELI